MVGPKDDRERAAYAEAADWLARLRADTRTPEVEQAFRVWLDSEPVNQRAFDSVTAVWDVAGGLRGILPPAQMPTPAAVTRRQALIGVGAIAVAGASLVTLRNAAAQDYQTTTAQILRVALKGGTRLLLDAESHIRVWSREGRAEIKLLRGRLNCDIQAGESGTFVCKVGQLKIEATSANFDVSDIGGMSSVVVARGLSRITFARGGAQDGRADLTEGDRLIVSGAGRVLRDRPSLRPLLAWQAGQIVLDNTTLAEAVAQFNRHSETSIVLTEDFVRNLRISGVYQAEDSEGFARSMEQVLPVKATWAGAQIEIARALE